MEASSENLPFGKVALSASGGVEIPPEPPEVGARTLSVATRLLAGASTFFFLAFAFAYFYLRSINQDDWWKPTATLLKEQKEVHVSLAPNAGLGVAFIVCVLLSVALTIVAGRQMKQRSRSWLMPAIGGLLLGLAAIALQCIEYTVQHFGPTDGAYASVFCAWTAFYLLAVLGTMYWLETQVATELRARRSPASHGDIEDPDQLIAPGLDAAVFYWAFLGAIGVVTYVTLYLL
jgi:heme/copper-type cytochrome/quinol oxidase subunit 3